MRGDRSETDKANCVDNGLRTRLIVQIAPTRKRRRP